MELIAKWHLLLNLWLMVIIDGSLVLPWTTISPPFSRNIRLKLLEITLDKVIGKCLTPEEKAHGIVELKNQDYSRVFTKPLMGSELISLFGR